MRKWKEFLLTSSLALAVTLTGCSSNEEKEENNGSSVVEQEPTKGDFEKMTTEESKVLQVGDVIEKEADRAVLEEKGLDYVYVYDVKINDEQYDPDAFYDYMDNEYMTTGTKGEKVIYTYNHLEVVEISYAKDKKTGKIMKKMRYGINTLQVDPLFPDLAKEKVKTK